MSIFNKIEEIFSKDVILILAEPLQKDSSTLIIQNYEFNNIPFIPLFTSKANLKKSLNGHELENEIIQIKGSYFCSLLKGDELITINPDLDDEIRTTANELQDLMKEQIAEELKPRQKA